MYGAVLVSHRVSLYPAPPHPAINVDVGAPIIAPSTHGHRAGVSGEVHVTDDSTHATGSVTVLEWFSDNLGGGSVATGGVRISTDNGAQSDDNDNDEVSVLEDILGRQVGQREDTACDEDGVDVSVGVDVDTVVSVGVHGQGVN